MPHVLPASLGAVDTTVLREAGAYASLDMGGREVLPSVIDSVQDRSGHVLWRSAQGLSCPDCAAAAADGGGAAGSAPVGTAPVGTGPVGAGATGTPAVAQGVDGSSDAAQPPPIVDGRKRIADAASTFQVVQMMKDVVVHGTGIPAVKGLDRPVAGKTGTSQDFNDAWFAGFTPNLVTVVWVGYDAPASLGDDETGGVLAGPIWNRYMLEALKDRPKLGFPVPDGVELKSWSSSRGMVTDAFKPDQVPGAGRIAGEPIAGGGERDQGLSASSADAEPVAGGGGSGGVDSGMGGLY